MSCVTLPSVSPLLIPAEQSRLQAFPWQERKHCGTGDYHSERSARCFRCSLLSSPLLYSSSPPLSLSPLPSSPFPMLYSALLFPLSIFSPLLTFSLLSLLLHPLLMLLLICSPSLSSFLSFPCLSNPFLLSLENFYRIAPSARQSVHWFSIFTLGSLASHRPTVPCYSTTLTNSPHLQVINEIGCVVSQSVIFEQI